MQKKEKCSCSKMLYKTTIFYNKLVTSTSTTTSLNGLLKDFSVHLILTEFHFCGAFGIICLIV